MTLLRSAALAALLALAAPAFAGDASAPVAASAKGPESFDFGMIPSGHVLLPKGEATAMVLLLSDSAGWSNRDTALAESLSGKGAFVIGIDLPAYYEALEKDEDDCVYMVSDIESLSQQVQRSVGGSIYRLPIVAGIGGGGALALAIAAQTPDATVQHTIAIDPAAGIPLQKELCTEATRERNGSLSTYGLGDGDLPDPVTVVETAAAPDDGRAHVAALVKDHDEIAVTDSDDDAATALAEAIDAVLEAPAADELGLPLSILETKPTRDTLAIIYSGDGGWRDIDKEIGQAFQDQGMPTIGVDALRYFWSERTPKETAADLSRIIGFYTKRWGVKHVLLVGYSFGADVLPTTFNLLPDADKAKVAELSLLAVSKSASFQISVMGWLGADDDDASNPAQLARIDPKLIQCVYGSEDDDTVCPDLKPSGVELIATAGGHHFDGDYAALAQRILAGLDARLKNRP